MFKSFYVDPSKPSMLLRAGEPFGKERIMNRLKLSAQRSLAWLGLFGLGLISWGFVGCSAPSDLAALEEISSPLRTQDVVWAKSAGSTTSPALTAITTSFAVGNDLYVGGWFSGSVTLAGGITLVSAGERDAFFGKIDMATGNYLWAKRGGGTGLDFTNRITADASGVWATGTFRGEATFDATSLTSPATANSAFVIYLSTSDGAVQWVKSFDTGAGNSAGTGIAVRSSALYVVGQFVGSVKWGATTVQSGYDISAPYTNASPFTAPTTADAFFLKIDKTTGNLGWLRRGGGSLNDSGSNVYATDDAVYIAGHADTRSRAQFEKRTPVSSSVTTFANYCSIWDATDQSLGTAIQSFVVRLSAASGNCLWAIRARNGSVANTHTYVYDIISNPRSPSTSYLVGTYFGTTKFCNNADCSSFLSLSSGGDTVQSAYIATVLGNGTFAAVKNFDVSEPVSLNPFTIQSSNIGVAALSGTYYQGTVANDDRLFVGGRRKPNLITNSAGGGAYDALVVRIIPSTLAINKVLYFGGKGVEGVLAISSLPSLTPGGALFLGGTFQDKITLGSTVLTVGDATTQHAYSARLNQPLCGYGVNVCQ